MIQHSGHNVAFAYLGEEHDEFADIRASLALRRVEGRLIHLNHISEVNWDEYDLVSLQMCRGFHRDARFLDKILELTEVLDSLSDERIPILNPPSLIRVAVDKGAYLRDLEKQGVGLVPTYWVKRGDTIAIEQIMKANLWDDVVLKPTISSRSWQTYRLSNAGGEYILSEPTLLSSKSKLDPRIDGMPAAPKDSDQLPKHERVFQQLKDQHDVCVQQFMPDILKHGETSFVFIDDSFSHAVQKMVGEGGWVAHELYGGANRSKEVGAPDAAWAQDIYDRIARQHGNLLYARIDAISDEAGELKLLECELVAPRLFLREGLAVEKYADAIVHKL